MAVTIYHWTRALFPVISLVCFVALAVSCKRAEHERDEWRRVSDARGDLLDEMEAEVTVLRGRLASHDPLELSQREVIALGLDPWGQPIEEDTP